MTSTADEKISEQPTPSMTAERLHRLLVWAMSCYVESRSTKDWLDLAEAHPAALVREMATKILLLEQRAEAAEASLHAERERTPKTHLTHNRPSREEER